jgi:hypothetical protein
MSLQPFDSGIVFDSISLFDSWIETGSTTAVGPPPMPFATAFGALLLAADRKIVQLLGGQPVTYAPRAGPSVAITGIFDAEYVLVKADTPIGVDALGPAVFLRLEDIPADPELDDPTLTIGGIAYKVSDRRPDGLGGIVLALRGII